MDEMTFESARALESLLNKKWWASYCSNGKDAPETIALKEELTALKDEAIRLFAKPEVADCRSCQQYSVFGGPGHRGSPRCRSGSIASGGTHSHCTCDTCY